LEFEGFFSRIYGQHNTEKLNHPEIWWNTNKENFASVFISFCLLFCFNILDIGLLHVIKENKHAYRWGTCNVYNLSAKSWFNNGFWMLNIFWLPSQSDWIDSFRICLWVSTIHGLQLPVIVTLTYGNTMPKLITKNSSAILIASVRHYHVTVLLEVRSYCQVAFYSCMQSIRQIFYTFWWTLMNWIIGKGGLQC